MIRNTLVINIRKEDINSYIEHNESLLAGEFHIDPKSDLGLEIIKLGDTVTVVLYAIEKDGESTLIGFENKLKIVHSENNHLNSTMLQREAATFRNHDGFTSYELRICSPPVNIYDLEGRP